MLLLSNCLAGTLCGASILLCNLIALHVFNLSNSGNLDKDFFPSLPLNFISNELLLFFFAIL